MRLENCKKGDYITVTSNGNGLLKHLTVGNKYYIESVKDKGLPWEERLMFKIRNDINKPKWYNLKMSCWFSASTSH